MKPIVENLRILITALCLITTLSSFVVVINNHSLSEESSNELIEFEECEEAITEQRQRRRKKNSVWTYPHRIYVVSESIKISSPVQIPSLHWDSERANINGAGCYLRT